MSKSDDPSKPESTPSLEEQIKEMFRAANLSFTGVPQAAEAAPAPASVAEDAAAEDRLRRIRDFRLKPRDICDYLARFVIRQDDAKKVLAVAVCDHYNHVRRCLENPDVAQRDYSKHNILMLGPTGVGKTYLVRCLAQLIGVPFVKADATKFSETGYVGRDVEDLVRDLVQAANGDVNLAQYGIVYLDEIDKIAVQSGAGGRDVSGRGVQVNLLKLMEEMDVNLFSQTDLIGQMRAIMDMQRGRDSGRRTINTRHILFIASGAFGPLAEKVRARVRNSRIGFSEREAPEGDEGEYLRQARTQDFIDYGFEPEFIGRLPVRVVCDALTMEDLQTILLKSEGSILNQYTDDFTGYGIELQVEPEAVAAIARSAASEKTGARGLMTVLERLFRDFKFELPSSSASSLVVTPALVEEPLKALAACLEENDIQRRDQRLDTVHQYAGTFQSEHGIQLVFRRETAEYVVSLAEAGKRPIADFCRDHFRDFEYGLKLISGNTGQTRFTVTRKMAEDPRGELSRLVAASFRKV